VAHICNILNNLGAHFSRSLREVGAFQCRHVAPPTISPLLAFLTNEKRLSRALAAPRNSLYCFMRRFI
jgi:hypothetical protein